LPNTTLLFHQTDGWPAALRLAKQFARDARGGDARRVATHLNANSGPLYEYLTEEILGHFDGAAQALLEEAAIPEKITQPRGEGPFRRCAHGVEASPPPA
jgi:ATP/maltotriose-dependent transcriptional regulator MalT